MRELIDRLNKAAIVDPDCMYDILYTRFPCSERLAKESPMLCQQEEDGSWTIGVMGLINGMLGVDDQDDHDGIMARVVRNECDLEDGESRILFVQGPQQEEK